MIWNNSDIDIWYRQNIFIYSRKNSTTNKLHLGGIDCFVHPDFWALKIDNLSNTKKELNRYKKGEITIWTACKILALSIKNQIFRV